MPDRTAPTSSVEVRAGLVEALRLDLVGPGNDHAFARELLPESPARWYLTGFLVPSGAPIEQRFDETSGEEIDAQGESADLSDATTPERAAAHRCLLPSSIGLSFLVPGGTKALACTVSWGDYAYEGPEGEVEPDPESSDAGPGDAEDAKQAETKKEGATATERPRGFRRTPRTEVVQIELPTPGGKPKTVKVPSGNGLVLVAAARSAVMESLPKGTKAVSVFLVNQRQPEGEVRFAYKMNAFQAELAVACSEGFVPRPDPRAATEIDDWDQRVSELQYRDVAEFAVGHGVSVSAAVDEDGTCRAVRTMWIPTAEVERVAPSDIPGVELGMEALGALASADAARECLAALASAYGQWIAAQRQVISGLSATRAQTASDMLSEAEAIARRIQAGIDLLEEIDVLEAFRIANRVVARALRQREAQRLGCEPDAVDAPEWRPFQLAFLLLTMQGIADPGHADREQVDLLFFPTGGGKTEAYFGLAAFTLVLRRLRNPGIRSAGMTVLMRYTLRLLTLDQLGRAAALICALELEREANPTALGEWPFEIGLWVGQGATPNRMGRRGDKSSAAEYTAYTKTMRYKRDDRSPSPIPIEQCPWCGTKFDSNSFLLKPSLDNPTDLRVHCVDHRCAFNGSRPLPIVAVDEPIYRRLPCFVIATVDKFAALPWTGETGTLFGKVDRYDEEGFYGPCNPRGGRPIPGGELPPPELIIQDELHLISGPLGTVAGLYETAIDALCSLERDGRRVRPKIVASTATVRRAESQIRALFGRSRVSVFPAPGPDRRDSFFAHTLASSESPARLYVGVGAQGRSHKVVLLRTVLALLGAGQTAWSAGAPGPDNPADPYMTLLAYFGSLRELGGSRRIAEDEVRTRLTDYGRRRRRAPEDDLFRARIIDYDLTELTSRVPTDEVATAKRRLALPFSNRERVDLALATNMISVGLDITRLGLMVVLGQPKTSSEYIQATSRVGRDPGRPGLVVTLMNVHRPRDRSHYERFTAYHASFYRHVEATSVTPFSPRALDRALPGALVALSRQGHRVMTPPEGAQAITGERSALDAVADGFAERAREHRGDLSLAVRQEVEADVLHRCRDLLDDWLRIAEMAAREGAGLQYQKEATGQSRRLLYGFIDPELPASDLLRRKFRANRSMRDVELSVEISIKDPREWGEEQ